MAYEETIHSIVHLHDRTYLLNVLEYQVYVLPTHELLQPVQLADINLFPLSQQYPGK